MSAAPNEAARVARAEAMPLIASDGFTLAALRYPSRAPLRGNIIVAGATGVPQRFYRRFAEHASANGFATLTVDYRGIGLSRPSSLVGFEMNYLDWATRDLAAAVDAMTSTTVPLFMVGHSFGGHAFGLLPNHARISRFYTFATGAGWHGWMPLLERVRVLALWRVVGPLIVRRKGYLAWNALGMGEDLPRNVFLQWRHWCRYPQYFFDDPAMSHVAEQFAAVRTPIIAANAVDDRWAPPRSRDAFMVAYRNTNWVGIDIDPAAQRTGPIGHMGYFRPSAVGLWDDVLAWFVEHEPLPAAVG